ncbi:MAG: c-type cytochrome, partial [Gammaproteobacteria bacterium]|nr:c-type cytochrome [Gammaproteobacteria bacterium]
MMLSSKYMTHPMSIFLLFILVSGQPLSAQEDGSALYAQFCSACHGKEGNGGVGVPLALPDFQYAVSDRFLFRTIRYGRPGRIMPAFKQLSDEQINAIVNRIRKWAPGKRISYPTMKVSGNPDHGKELFQKNCAACHGANGEGGHGTGVTFSRPRDLPIIAPALNNSGFLAAASDQMIKA